MQLKRKKRKFKRELDIWSTRNGLRIERKKEKIWSKVEIKMRRTIKIWFEIATSAWLLGGDISSKSSLRINEDLNVDFQGRENSRNKVDRNNIYLLVFSILLFFFSLNKRSWSNGYWLEKGHWPADSLLRLFRDIGPAVRVFANGPGDLGSIPGRVIPKTLKMVLDTTLLNTQHYKVRFKGKVEQSWEWSSALPYTLV